MTEWPAPARRPRRWLRRLATGLGVSVAVLAVVAAVLASNTQLIVGALQGYRTQNSYQPRATPAERVRADGVRYLNDIQYGDAYPNSHVDISYPAGSHDGPLPTVVFAHGGGLYGGDKLFADPISADASANVLYDRIIEQGFALVTVNYALVPEHRFPTPVRQLDQALGFLRAHASDYQLDMDHVIIMGSSAGAVMATQYGAALSNPEYAKRLGIDPLIPLASVAGLVIDDAPLAIDDFNLPTMVLMGNYVSGNIFLGKEERANYDPIDDVTEAFPPAFLIGSSYSGEGYAHDMQLLSDALARKDVRHEFFYETKADGTEVYHGFFAAGLAFGEPVAVHAFERLSNFLAGVRRQR